jgi:hypothetical protein
MKDDVFDVPELDAFESEVETLVILAYETTITGVNRLDEQRRPHPDLNANPELQVEIDWWEQQVSVMKQHAANMALVSLVTLVDAWRERHNKIQDSVDLKKFKWKDIRTARNSIIHHRGKPEFVDNYGDHQKVSDLFLDFDEFFHEERVTVSESVLKEVAHDLTSYVNEFNKTKHK